MDEFQKNLVAIQPKLRAHARQLVRDHASADDLVQDTICNALAGKDSFVPGTYFAAWIHRILRNKFLSNCRSSKSRRTTDIDDVPESGLSIQAHHETSVLVKEMERALASLRPEHREAIVMFAIEDMTYNEMALVLGIPLGSAKSRMFRARAEMNAWLQGEAPKPPTKRVGRQIKLHAAVNQALREPEFA